MAGGQGIKGGKGKYMSVSFDTGSRLGWVGLGSLASVHMCIIITVDWDCFARRGRD